MGLSAGCSTLRKPERPDPLTPEERLNLGVAYEQEGKPDLAFSEYKKAERGTLEARAQTYQGNLYLKQSEHSKAEKAYRKALKTDPDQLQALNNLAWLLAESGELEEAEKRIRHALSLNPSPRAPYEDTLRVILKKRDGEDFKEMKSNVEL